MTSRMRELVELLGKTIQESLTDSEEIANVVQEIKQEGYDVTLMIEASIGLNELQADDDSEDGDDDEQEVGSFTQNDLHFLRSLRISVEGDEEDRPQAE